MSEPSAELIQFVDLCELSSIHHVELSASRKPGFRELGGEALNVDPAFTLRVESDEETPQFLIAIRVEFSQDWGDLSAEVEGNYEASSESFPSQELITEYANEVAVMTLIPFLRQAVADLTQRVFNAPLIMPVYRRRQLKFGLPRQVDDAD